MTLKILTGAVALAMLSGQAVLLAAPLQKKVLILGVDGTRPDALAVARTPNLNALRSQGCFSDRAITHPVTHSAACWSSMFTGVWGDKHGVNSTNNSFTGNRFDLYPNFMRRLETANSNLHTVAFTRWAPLSTALPGTDGITNFPQQLPDDDITAATRDLLTRGNPDVFYTLLLDVDTEGHKSGWGPTVTNYVTAIETADRRVGEIMGALTNRVTYTNEDWLVIVLSDHGEHDSTVERSRITFHLFWGPSVARGTIRPSPSIVDVCATVLTHMGVPIDPTWNLDARVEGLPLPPTRYGTNLIFNGDAESNSGTNNYGTNNYTPNRGIAWWYDVSSLTLGVYGSNTNFPSPSSPGPTNRGNNFFLGGIASGIISQTIDLSDLAADIDDPGVDYQLTGWFGGRGSDEDRMTLGVRFLNVTNGLLGTNYVGAVTAADRSNVTGLLQRSTNGTLPSGTRLVEFVLTARITMGGNDGSADNLSFVLTPRADAPFPILARGFASGNWQVQFDSKTNRLYGLERSQDFQTWTTVSPLTPGTGSQLYLMDTHAPDGQAFYRVSGRRP